VIVVKFVIDIYVVLVVIEVYQRTQHKESAIGQGSLRLIDDDADDAPVIAWDGRFRCPSPSSRTREMQIYIITHDNCDC
jgi:hypothetical protein